MRKRTEFDYMWEQSVLPLINKCDEELDTEYKSAVSLSIRDLNVYKEELKELYHHKREWLKREYLPYDDKPILDFHKLSAIMCRCLIGNKPFVFDQKVAERYLKKTHAQRGKGKKRYDILRYQIDNIYINYKLAFLVGEAIIFDDLVYWVQNQIAAINKNTSMSSEEAEMKKNIYEDFNKKLDAIGSLAEYEWAQKHDPFFESMVSCFFKNDLLKRDFDYLLFSASMFQWQEYTKYTIFNEILKEKSIEAISVLDLMHSQEK